MRDMLLEGLKAKFSSMTALNEADTKFLTESKKRYPHLNEAYLLENRKVINNIQAFHVSTKSIKEAYGVNLAKAMQIQKAFRAFAIAEYYARNEQDEDSFSKKINESCKVILELEGDFNPEQTIGPKKIDTSSGEDQFDPNARIGGVGDFGGDAKSMAKAKPGQIPASKDEKKKGFLSKVKSFLAGAGNIVKKVATSKETYKALAIGASMVVLGLIAASIGGWAAIGFAGVKGILGLFSVYKGSKELIKTGDFAQGKKGIEGVKQWVKSSKDPKNAAKIVIAMAKVAMGAWGASSAVGQVMNQLAVMDASKLGSAPEMAKTGYTKADLDDVKRAAGAEPAPTPAAPVHAPAAAPEAPHAAATDMTKYSSYGVDKANAIQGDFQNAVIGPDPKKALDGLFRPFAEKVGQAVSSGSLSAEQGKAILHGFAAELHNNNGSLPTEGVFKKLLSLAKI